MSNTHPSLPAWADQLRPGAVLLFRFPERHDGFAGKRRPCLVLGKRQGPSGLQIALGYGTSARTAANRGFDLMISSDHDRQSAGLARPSRFVLARRITVSADDPRFDTGTHASPIVGNLSASRLAEFSTLIAALAHGIFVDQIAGAGHRSSVRAGEMAPHDPSGSAGTQRREITAPARRSRRDRSRPTRTVIVEHRSRRAPRPTPSAA